LIATLVSRLSGAKPLSIPPCVSSFTSARQYASSLIADWALLLAAMTRPASRGTTALASRAAFFFI